MCEILRTVLEDFTLRVLLVASIVTIIINEIVEEDERATGTFSGNLTYSLDRWCGHFPRRIRRLPCQYSE